MLQNVMAKRIIYKLHMSDYNICICVLQLENHVTTYFLIPIKNLHWLQDLAQIIELQVLFVVGGSAPSDTTAVYQTLHLSAIIASL